MNFVSLFARERAKKIENDVSKGSVKIRHRWYGSAELFGFGHCRFGSAESWFGLKYGNKIRPNRIVRPNLYMRFGRIRRLGAPLLIELLCFVHFRSLVQCGSLCLMDDNLNSCFCEDGNENCEPFEFNTNASTVENVQAGKISIYTSAVIPSSPS